MQKLQRLNRNIINLSSIPASLEYSMYGNSCMEYSTDPKSLDAIYEMSLIKQILSNIYVEWYKFCSLHVYVKSCHGGVGSASVTI